MRKKPFLSLYEHDRIKNKNELSVGTESSGGETSDEDEFYSDETFNIKSLEANNGDNYILGSTYLTDTMEDSDIDEFILD